MLPRELTMALRMHAHGHNVNQYRSFSSPCYALRTGGRPCQDQGANGGDGGRGCQAQDDAGEAEGGPRRWCILPFIPCSFLFFSLFLCREILYPFCRGTMFTTIHADAHTSSPHAHPHATLTHSSDCAHTNSPTDPPFTDFLAPRPPTHVCGVVC
jgi:hypothetical protein